MDLIVRKLFEDRVLMTRQAARSLEDKLAASLREVAETNQDADAAQLTVDFDGVLGAAPSFVDELLLVFESITKACAGVRRVRLIIANPPTRLSSKFEAIARGHQMTIRVLPDNSWLLCDAGDAAAG